MYVHVDPELLERKPWIGVLIGLVGVVFFGLMFHAFYAESRRLGSQTAPEDVTPETARLSAVVPRRWVRLSGGTWQCGRAIVEKRGLPERLVFGRIGHVYVPIRAADGRVSIVAKFEGEVDCASAAALPVTGMLVRPGDSVWGGGVPRRQLGVDPDFVLTVGDGPAAARGGMQVGGALLLAVALFAAYYLKKWQRQREALSRPA